MKESDAHAPARTMPVAKFISNDNAGLWARQTPDGDGVVGGIRFVFDSACTDYDVLVAFNGVPEHFADRVKRSRAIFVAGEPTSIKRYDRRFLAQFGTILTTDRETRHPNRIASHGGIPWQIGIPMKHAGTSRKCLDYRALERLTNKRTKLLSVICSTKTITPAQRLRIPFVQALKSHFGERLDVFGRGFHEIDDKVEGLVDYRFHVALENSDAPDYWSEKIADPFIAGAFPFYWGCRNLEEYFPENSFMRIDLHNPGSAIAAIEAAIAADCDRAARPALAEAKRMVLTEHNLFALVGRILPRLRQPIWERRREIASEFAFIRKPLLYRVAMRARAALYRTS
jgi:Glycosyltransferase family 10 (fucosyltransferase) C-term